MKSAKERIQETAYKLFYTHGIKATGVDTIIKESGVAKMSLYKYFPSKHDLVMDFLQYRHRFWLDWLKKEVERKTTNKKRRILAVFDVLQNWFSDPGFRGCAFINTAIETCDDSAEEHRFSLGHKKDLQNYLETLCREASLKNPRKKAEQLLLLVDGAIVKAQMEGSSQAARVAKKIAEEILG